jgi:hypothetical protein
MRHRQFLLVPLVVALLCASSAAHAGGGSTSLVVAQLYASGGNSGATYANDYVELFNRGTSSVDLTGWTVQYASAASTSWAATPLSGTVAPGRAYLVQLASGGANGTALPAADATGTSNLAATGGKVAVVDSATPLSCGAAAGSCASSSGVADLVGYGTAADFEGAGAAPAPDATSAIVRAGGGCTDTDSNTDDFSSIAAAPANSSAPASPCSGAGGSSVFASASVRLQVQPVIAIALGQPNPRLRRARRRGDGLTRQRERDGHLERHGGLHAHCAPHGVLAARSPTRAVRDPAVGRCTRHRDLVHRARGTADRTGRGPDDRLDVRGGAGER